MAESKPAATTHAGGVVKGESVESINELLFGEKAKVLLKELGFRNSKTTPAGNAITSIPLTPDVTRKSLISLIPKLWGNDRFSDGYLHYSPVLSIVMPHVGEECVATVTFELYDSGRPQMKSVEGQRLEWSLNRGPFWFVLTPQYALPVADTVGNLPRQYGLRTTVKGVSTSENSSPFSVVKLWDQHVSPASSYYAEEKVMNQIIKALRRRPLFADVNQLVGTVRGGVDISLAGPGKKLSLNSDLDLSYKHNNVPKAIKPPVRKSRGEAVTSSVEISPGVFKEFDRSATDTSASEKPTKKNLNKKVPRRVVGAVSDTGAYYRRPGRRPFVPDNDFTRQPILGRTTSSLHNRVAVPSVEVTELSD